MPNARVTDTVPDGRDELTVSWPPANSTDFLRLYRVSFSFTVAPSSRKRRQAMSPMDVQPDRTSTTLQFQAFSDYNVNVDAVFAPPPNRMDIVVPLLPETTFTTPERPASIPTNVVGRNETNLRIRLDWGEPVSRNGIITGYRVRIGTSETRVTGRTFLSQELSPNTEYTFQVLAINGGGDGLAATVTLRSGFSAPVTVGPSMEVAQSATVPTSDNTVAIISAVVSAAVFIALIIAATVIIVIALILRSRKAEYKPNRSLEYEEPGGLVLSDLSPDSQNINREDYETIEADHEYEMLDKYSQAYEDVKMPPPKSEPANVQLQQSTGDYDYTQCPAYVSVATTGINKGETSDPSPGQK